MGLAVIALVGAVGLAALPAAPPEPEVTPSRIAGWKSTKVKVETGRTFTAKLAVRPGDSQRRYQVKWRKAGKSWRVKQKGRSTPSGSIRVRRTLRSAGRYHVKVKVLRSSDHFGVMSKRKVVKVKSQRRAPNPAPAPTPPPAPTPTPTPTSSTPPGFDPLFTAYAAGDIGYCGGAAAQTAALIPDGGLLLALGDLAYPDGTATDFADCYLPHYGRLLASTQPVPGNHEYRDPALAYFGVFGARVGIAASPWYVVRRQGWSFYHLNSNCYDIGVTLGDPVDGCDTTSHQYQWLAAELAADPSQCIVATWHHPQWSAGTHGPYSRVADMYSLLLVEGADLILSGHEHTYQRFARLDPAGIERPTGVRQIVVGTGGAPLTKVGAKPLMPQAWSDTSHGVLRLGFGVGGYTWRFLATDGANVDSGYDSCG